MERPLTNTRQPIQYTTRRWVMITICRASARHLGHQTGEFCLGHPMDWCRLWPYVTIYPSISIHTIWPKLDGRLTITIICACWKSRSRVSPLFAVIIPCSHLRRLQIIPKVLSGFKVRVLCRPLEFFFTNLGKPCLHDHALCPGTLSCWKICEPLT